MLCLDEEYPVLAPVIDLASKGRFHNHVMFRCGVPFAPAMGSFSEAGCIIMLCLGEEFPVLVPAICPALKGGFHNHVMFE